VGSAAASDWNAASDGNNEKTLAARTDSSLRPCFPALIALSVLRKGGVMSWQVAVAWLLAAAVASVIYFVPMTRFVDNLSERVTAAVE
jgi:hypothetical protein